jgi:hypothetical protein
LTFLALLRKNQLKIYTSVGLDLSEKREYDGSLWELNKAMGMVKRNYNHPLREKIEEAIRVTKAKTVVARYATRRRSIPK